MASFNPNPPDLPAAGALSVAQIAAKLGGDGVVSPDGWCRCPCPAHGGTNSNLSFKLDGSARLLVTCWSQGCDPDAIRRAIDEKLGTRFGRPDAAADFADDPATPGELNVVEAAPGAAALALWQAELVGYDAMRRAESTHSIADSVFNAARPIQHGDLADRYLRGRRIELERFPASLRLHEGLWHVESRQRWPAIVAKVTASTGQLQALQRTFLNPETGDKAPIEPVRKLLGSMRGGSVHLFDPGGNTLLVGEGVETVLASLVLARWSYAGWAGLSTSGLAGLQLPSRFHRVLIAADNDISGAGLRAAKTLATRLRAAGRHVAIRLPPRVGSDWNDVLEQTNQGAAA